MECINYNCFGKCIIDNDQLCCSENGICLSSDSKIDCDLYQLD